MIWFCETFAEESDGFSGFFLEKSFQNGEIRVYYLVMNEDFRRREADGAGKGETRL